MSEPEDPKEPPPPSAIGEPMSEHEPEPLPGESVPELAIPPAPIAPPTDDDLREAVGVKRREKVRLPTEDDEDERDADGLSMSPEQRARRRKMWLTLSFSLVIGLIIVAFVFLGRANSSRFVFACASDKITAEQGRGFPPWGTRELDGPEWAPIAIPPQAECKTHETEDESTLEGWFLDALIDQARAKLTAKDVTAVDDAEKQLQQALLLARAPERRDQRHKIEHMLGNVVYWRGVAKVKAATDALADASKLFDEAARKRPIDVNDAEAWSDYAKEVSDDLRLGPEALRPPAPLGATGAPGRPEAPRGVALPVEPPRVDANMGAPITPPDAGVPSGGVLL